MNIFEEIQELLDSLSSQPLEDLLKEIAESPIPFVDYESELLPRKTRKRKGLHSNSEI